MGSASPAILLSSVDVLKTSHSAGSSSVSSNSLDGPGVSSLLVVEATTGLGVLSLLEMIVGSSSESGHSMGVSMLQTCCWGSSCLKK